MSAATRRARRRVRAELPTITALSISDYSPGDASCVDDLLGGLLTSDMPRCEHLQRQAGEGLVYVGEGFGRCVDCHMGGLPYRPEAAFLAKGLRTECGRCGAASPLLRLTPVSVKVAPSWTVFSAVCPPCEVVFRHEIPMAAAGSGGRRAVARG